MTEIGKKYRKAAINLILILVIVFLCVFIAPRIILLFMPFIIGWFLAWLASPLVRFLEEKMKIKRKVGSALVFLSVLAGIGILVYLAANRLITEVAGWIRGLPQMWQNVKMEFVAVTQRWSKVIDGLPSEVVERAQELGKVLGTEMSVMVGKLSIPTIDALESFAGKIPGTVIAVIMCLLSAYFFVAEKDTISLLLNKIFPDVWLEKCKMLKLTTIDVMVGYWKAQFKIEIWVYVVVVIGFLFLKVRYGYLIAILIAALDMLPVLGTGVILLPWTVFELLTGDYMYALGLLVIWGIGLLVRQIIQPKVLGDSTGIEPIPTLILLYVGYKLAGVIGMMAAVPLGMLVLAMNKEGFFDVGKKSIVILWQGFHELRQYTEEEPQEWDSELRNEKNPKTGVDR